MKFAAVAAATLALAATAAASPSSVQPACATHSKRSTEPQVAVPAGGVIVTHTSGLIRLGVNPPGNLNTIPLDRAAYNHQVSVGGISQYGLRYVDADAGNILGTPAGREYESTAPGCLCEGWGAGALFTNGTSAGAAQADDSTGYSGFSDVLPLEVLPTADAAATNVTASVQAGNCLRVVHHYFPSPSRYLYQVDVSLTNICDAPLGRVRYIRVMDWDEEPTAFSETVELNPGNALDLECLHNDGFATPNTETVDNSGINGLATCVNSNTVLPVSDQGAYFRFNFADITNANPLLPGATKTLTTYYGAAPTRALAANALVSLGVEAYSFGHSVAPAPFGPNGYTTVFGFSGIGGDPVIPDGEFIAPCDALTPCENVHVESDGRSVTLRFDTQGPYSATCQ